MKHQLGWECQPSHRTVTRYAKKPKTWCLSESVMMLWQSPGRATKLKIGNPGSKGCNSRNAAPCLQKDKPTAMHNHRWRTKENSADANSEVKLHNEVCGKTRQQGLWHCGACIREFPRDCRSRVPRNWFSEQSKTEIFGRAAEQMVWSQILSKQLQKSFPNLDP